MELYKILPVSGSLTRSDRGPKGSDLNLWHVPNFSRIVWRPCLLIAMSGTKSKPTVTIRDLDTYDDLKQVEALERTAWGLADQDVTPLTLAIATRHAGNIWLGAFDGAKLVGFAFGFLGQENGHLMVHSHMLAVLAAYQNSDLGRKLKLAQRDRVLALRLNGVSINLMTWTFDPLQSKNAHLNFAKLGVIASAYKVNFYGPQTSSVLHQNGTDRLWVSWPLSSRRVKERLQGKDNRPEMLDTLKTLSPLIGFGGHGRPVRGDLFEATRRQRIAIEIPGDIGTVERKDPSLAAEWRNETRWAFTEALGAGFFVAEFCRSVRGQQGPGVYLLEKGSVEDLVPELMREPVK